MTKSSNQTLLIRLSLFVLCMFGFGFVMVPVFHWICHLTGMHAAPVESKIGGVVRYDQNFRMELLFHRSATLPIDVRMDHDHLVFHPGEEKSVQASAVNNGSDPVKVRLASAIAPEPMAGKIGSTLKTQYVVFKPHEKKTWDFTISLAPEFPSELKSGIVSLYLFDVNQIKRAS